MEVLDWTKMSLEKSLATRYFPGSPQSRLALKFSGLQSPKSILSLTHKLEAIFSGSETELKLVLSSSWTLFWKLREGGSRALLAHPEAEQWVAMVALEKKDAEKWISGLRALEWGMAASLKEFAVLNSLSNLDLMMELEK